MSKSTDTWMPRYVGDWDRDTGHLSNEENGAYVRLIDWYWINGPLPDDDKKLGSIIRDHRGWKRMRQTLVAFFQRRDGLLYHKRVEAELAKAKRITEVRGKAGSEGAESKWGPKITAIDSARATRSQRLSDARAKATHTKDEWLSLVVAVGNRCMRCDISADDLHGNVLCKDHIVPLYQGGSDGIDNIQPMCRNCNSSKGPEAVDYRDHNSPGWRERMAKCLEKRLAE